MPHNTALKFSEIEKNPLNQGDISEPVVIEIEAFPEPNESETRDTVKKMQRKNGWSRNIAERIAKNELAFLRKERDDFFKLLELKTDSLTRLASRREFDEALSNELARAERFKQKMSLLMLDMDKFKSINDNLGHKVGDRALQLLADIIRSSFRAIDTKARVGGEEFGIIVVNTDEQNALAERLRSNVETEFKKTLFETIKNNFPEIYKKICAEKTSEDYIDFDKAVSGTVSIGIATFNGDEEKKPSPNDIYQNADDALYRAKNSGRNQIAYNKDGEIILLNKNAFREKLLEELNKLLPKHEKAGQELDKEVRILKVLELTARDPDLIEHTKEKIRIIKTTIISLNEEINGYREKIVKLLKAA